MGKVAVAGVVTQRGLGDALQYYVAIKLLQRFLCEAEVTFFCPSLKDSFFVFGNLNLNAHLVDWGSVGKYNILWNRLSSSSLRENMSEVERKMVAKVQIKKASPPSRIIRNIGKKYEKYFSPYMIDKSKSVSIMKTFSFDASIFGGHTISGKVYPYIYKYEGLRSATKGPMVTSPISVSRVALEYFQQNTSKFKKTLMLKRLKKSLQKFDFIYTRGPFSLRILRDHLDINEEKVSMALDSGFGARIIHPCNNSKGLKKKALKILIIPRKNYFYMYEKQDSYKLYLNALAGLIYRLYRNFDVEVYITSQTIDAKYNIMGGQAAVNDLLAILIKNRNKHLKYPKTVMPEGLADSCRLFSSMDLVISSYMHGGIAGLSLGVPAFFILPSSDIKVLDVLSFLGLDTNSFLIDLFDTSLLKTENFANKIERVVENLKFHKKSLKRTIDRALPTIQHPVKKLIELSE